MANTKIKLTTLLEFLRQETDMDHPATTNQIIKRMVEQGVSCDRKTLARDVALLNERGYEVMRTRVGHENAYYVEDRDFDVAELKLLIDAVQAASFVTEKKTEALVKKIAQLGGSHQAEILNGNLVRFNTRKHSNEQIYLISNNHPAIVSREVFQAVQSEMARRTSKHKISDLNITEQAKYSGKYALSEKLYCGDCGSAYRRRVWVRKDGNKVVWRCISRLEHGSQYCHSSITVEEPKLHQAICNALNQVASVKDKAFDLLSVNLMYAVTGDNKVLDAYSIEQSIERVKAEMDNAVEKCAKTEGDVSRFLEGISQLNQQLIALREQLEIAKKQSAASEAVCTDVERIKKMLSDDSLRFDEYDDKYVRVLIDCIKVNTDSTLTVIIKGGVPITVDIPT